MTNFGPRFCLGCSITFQPKRKDQQYHDRKCRLRAYHLAHPRVAKTAEPQLTSVAVKTTAPTPKRTRTPRPAPKLSTRLCQRPGCGKHVRYDADRFCSPAHEIADLRDDMRERRKKNAAAEKKRAKDMKTKAEAYIASLSPARLAKMAHAGL